MISLFDIMAMVQQRTKPSPLLTATAVLGIVAAAPLPSWSDTSPKQAIIAFVERTTKEGAAEFVPIPERIAVFDNDGTLWSKQPMYFQAFYIFDRIKTLAPPTSQMEGQAAPRFRPQGRKASQPH